MSWLANIGKTVVATAVTAGFVVFVPFNAPAVGATFDLNSGTLLAIITEPSNDPSPSDLVCSFSSDECGIEQGKKGFSIDWKVEDVEIESAALGKFDTDGSGFTAGLQTGFSITQTDSKSGAWQQIVGVGDLLTHYVAVKAGSMWALYDFDFAALGATVGDTLKGSYSTSDLSVGSGNQPNLSHISWYNSEPSVSAVPLPAALPLFGGALGLIGLLGWRRKRTAVA